MSAVLKIYLKDEVVISDELVRLFENNMQLGGNQISYSDTLIMYSCWDAKNLATECIHTWPADAL